MSAAERTHMISALALVGIAPADIDALRRISGTLHRWHELECGAADGWYLDRDDPDGDPPGRPYMRNEDGKRRYTVADRETGALRRLTAIMARYPALQSYVQGDPRGSALYILRPGDVPDGADPGCYYSRGIAVW